MLQLLSEILDKWYIRRLPYRLKALCNEHPFIKVKKLRRSRKHHYEVEELASSNDESGVRVFSRENIHHLRKNYRPESAKTCWLDPQQKHAES